MQSGISNKSLCYAIAYNHEWAQNPPGGKIPRCQFYRDFAHGIFCRIFFVVGLVFIGAILLGITLAVCGLITTIIGVLIPRTLQATVHQNTSMLDIPHVGGGTFLFRLGWVIIVLVVLLALCGLLGKPVGRRIVRTNWWRNCRIGLKMSKKKICPPLHIIRA